MLEKPLPFGAYHLQVVVAVRPFLDDEVTEIICFDLKTFAGMNVGQVTVAPASGLLESVTVPLISPVGVWECAGAQPSAAMINVNGVTKRACFIAHLVCTARLALHTEDSK